VTDSAPGGGRVNSLDPRQSVRELNIFGRQRQQTLPIAAAHCCKKILHNLDILMCAYRNLSITLTIETLAYYQRST
jgi:hypothetical protein